MSTWLQNRNLGDSSIRKGLFCVLQLSCYHSTDYSSFFRLTTDSALVCTSAASAFESDITWLQNHVVSENLFSKLAIPGRLKVWRTLKWSTRSDLGLKFGRKCLTNWTRVPCGRDLQIQPSLKKKKKEKKMYDLKLAQWAHRLSYICSSATLECGKRQTCQSSCSCLVWQLRVGEEGGRGSKT